MNNGRKRSQSSSNSESSDVSDSEQGNSPLLKTRSPEIIALSSDSESSSTVGKKSRRKKHKNSEILDYEHISVIRSGHNGKQHRHKCHHRHHHGHHTHHKVDTGHRSREREERVHRRTCSKHRIVLDTVKIKEEPRDEDNAKRRKSYSSHRRKVRGNEDGYENHNTRYDHHTERASASRSRSHGQRENTYHRKEEFVGRSEQQTSNERQTNEERSEEQESRKVKNNRNETKRGATQGRRNRWGSIADEPVSSSRPIKQESHSDNEAQFEWGKKSDVLKNEEEVLPGQKDKPNFGLSGKLTEDTNTFNGVVIKYSEPPEARKPKRRWRFYPFKGDQGLPTLYIHRQSSYLIGRDRKVADIPVDHPSCSKQHAALQYRLVPFNKEDGTMGKRVRPYIIDLESANGTFVNNVKVEPKTYVELLEKDVVKFGFSSREYVLLHEQSKDDELDDDVTGGN